MSQTVFIAGATGYTGREVVRLCAEAGHRTVAHVRPDSTRGARWRERFEGQGAQVDTTAWDEQAMITTLSALRPDVVFALLGTTRSRAREVSRRGGDPAAQSYEAVDYGLTALLLRACVIATSAASQGEGRGPPRFVYLSSLGTKEGARSRYLAVRWKTEEAVRDSGLPHTLARASFISGPDRDDDRPGERIGAAVADAGLRALSLLDGGRLRSRYGPHSNTALAAGLIRCAFDPAFANKVAEASDLRG